MVVLVLLGEVVDSAAAYGKLATDTTASAVIAVVTGVLVIDLTPYKVA